MQQDDVAGLAAEIAYHWIFAIPPLVILVVMLGALLDGVANVNVVGQLREQINERAPVDTASVLNRLVDNAVAEVSGGVATFGVIVAAVIALWSGSNGVGALIKAFNRALGVDEVRPFWRRRLVAVGLTVALVGILNAALALLVYGRRIGEWLADKVGAGTMFSTAWTIAWWPIVVAAILAVIILLYRIGPNVELPIALVARGAAVAAGLWVMLVLGFALYLRFSNPGGAYGALGGVIVLLFFLYLTGLVLLVGAEVNAVLQERRGEKNSPAIASLDGPSPRRHAPPDAQRGTETTKAGSDTE